LKENKEGNMLSYVTEDQAFFRAQKLCPSFNFFLLLITILTLRPRPKMADYSYELGAHFLLHQGWVEIQLKQKFQNLPPSLARFALVITS
jgi:hypothetical protein